MTLQESTDADRSMLDITVTFKGIEKLQSNLNSQTAADPDQIKPIPAGTATLYQSTLKYGCDFKVETTLWFKR